ncbi:MAG: hypothetical protein WCW64_00505 [Phycisphaerae bacterium]
MGTQYAALLEEATKKGGLTLATRVAITLGAGGESAKQVPDDPEKVAKAKAVIAGA